MSNKKSRKREMDEFLNPRILTLDEALAIAEKSAPTPDESRQNTARAGRALRDRVTCRFSGPKDFPRLTYGERMVWDLMYLQGEVLNGGFHQYLSNSTGETGEEVKGYLKRIGATSTLLIVETLSQIFPEGKIPRDREERNLYLEKAEEAGNRLAEKFFDRLDSEFYEQAEDLNALMIEFAKKNRSEFSNPTDEVIREHKRLFEIRAFCLTNGV